MTQSGKSSNHGPASNVLITGFGPFPGVDQNASGPLAMALAVHANKTMSDGGRYSFHTHVLPTEWEAGPAQVLHKLERLKPILVLHFGVSEKATGMVIETLAHNEARDAPDAVGRLPLAAKLCDVTCNALPATLAPIALSQALPNTSVCIKPSKNAGGYLCNAALFTTLNARYGLRPHLAGFVHIPTDPAVLGIDHDALIVNAATIIQAGLEHIHANAASEPTA